MNKEKLTIETFSQFATVRDENGLLGLIYKEAEILPCEYNEITRMDDYYLCRKSGAEVYIDFNGKVFQKCEYAPARDESMTSEGFVIIRNGNGKFGLLSPERREILPQDYDDIHKWMSCDVIAARRGNRVFYYDTAGKQILTNVRDIPTADDELYPYYIGEPQTNVIQLMDLSSDCVGDDYCFCYGRKAGLSRRLHSDHMVYLQRLANVIPFRQGDIDSFKAWDTYIYASFAVDSDKNLVECIDKLISMGLYRSSWYWMYLVLLPENASGEEIENAKWIIECLHHDLSSNTVKGVAFGKSASIKQGVKIIATRYFRDHWPSAEEFEESSLGNKTSLYYLKRYFKKLSDKRQEKLDSAIRNVIYAKGGYETVVKNWSLKKSKLNWLISQGAVIPERVINELITDYVYCPSRKSMIIRTLLWALKHGANVNIIKGGETPLDYLERSATQGRLILIGKKLTSTDIIPFKRILLDHGARHALEIRAEECKKRGFESIVYFGESELDIWELL